MGGGVCGEGAAVAAARRLGSIARKKKISLFWPLKTLIEHVPYRVPSVFVGWSGRTRACVPECPRAEPTQLSQLISTPFS